MNGLVIDYIPMLIFSIIAGLLSTMNIWAINIKDVRFHINDLYMAFLMTGWMLLLQSIYYYNITLIIISIFIIIITFIAIRNQFLINDYQYLNGMIPHHSMAILMSKRIKNKSKDPQVIELANSIIQSQNTEIIQMNNIIKKY